jgi:hypothetical protein
MNERWFEVVMTRLLSLKNPYLMYLVITRLSKRLTYKILDNMELEVLWRLSKVEGGANE